MADQHNSNIPAMGNQVSADIPDIKENLEFHKDAFERLFETWSDSDNSAAVIDSAVGFSDGTYTYDFPTNPTIAANSIIMLGNSDTVVWMYLNTAPPGWKALSTGADSVLGVAGGSGAYNVNGGNPDSSATWTISGFVGHVHTMGTHRHNMDTSGTTSYNEFDIYPVGSKDEEPGNNYIGIATNTETGTGETLYHMLGRTELVDPGDTNSKAETQNGTWRPKASVGKLFQLDTA